MSTPDAPALGGVFVAAYRRSLPKLVGQDRYEEALATLPDELRTEFQTTTSFGWGSLEMVDALLAAMSDVTGRSVTSLNADAVAMNMDLTIQGVWRILVQSLTVRMLVKRGGLIYSRAYNIGSAHPALFGQNEGRLTVTGWRGGMNATAIQSTAIAVEKLLHHAGEGKVTMRHTRLSDGVDYRIAWGR